MKKRIISVLLVFVMLFAMVPEFAWEVDASTESWLWPVKDCRKISSNFGWRDLYGSGYYDNKHNGIDIADGRSDLPVRASKSGTIITSLNNCSHDDNSAICYCNGRAGNYIVIKHDDGTYSRYLHLRSAGMRGKGSVSQGDIIGYMGSSGESYGYHLHFDMCTDINNREATLLNPMPTNSEVTIVNSYSLPSGWASAKTTYIFEVNSLIKETYYTYCRIQVTADSTYIKTLPCSRATDPNSDDVELTFKDVSFVAVGLVRNFAGNLWYKVVATDGSYGYMYAGDAKYIAPYTGDITGSGITVPTEHKQGNVYVLTGTVKSKYNKLDEVSAYVYSGSSENGTRETGASATVNSISYALGGSYIDNKTEFNKLSVGTHTYIVKAYYTCHYALDAKNIGGFCDDVEVYRKTFNVISGTSACSHSYSSYVSQEPTCTDNGVRTYTCSKCGASYTESIPSLGGHSFDSYTVNREPTCITSGIRTYTCSVCGVKTTEAIPATGVHSYYEMGRVEATCTEAGSVTYTCYDCGNTYTETLYPDGESHSYYLSSAVEPTCAQEGYYLYACRYCSYSFYEYIPTTEDHDYGSYIEKQPTCVGPGTIKYICRACGDSYTEDYYIPGNHIYEKKVVEPTCTAEGFTVYDCRYCKEMYFDDYVPATGHRYVSEKIEATCTENGYTIFECTGCGFSYVDYLVFAKGHVYANESYVQPTETEKGILYIECISCGEADEVVLPVLNAEDYEYNVLREPTESSDGIGEYVWKNSSYGSVRIRVSIPKITAKVSSVSIYSLPAKTKYYVGESLNTAGLSLIVTYTDGGYEIVSEGYTVSGFSSSTVGIKEITVTYEGKPAKFFAEIVERDLSVVQGDINQDGVVTSVDSNYIKRALAGKIYFEPGSNEALAADVNGDGKISAVDANILKRIVAGAA